MGGGIKISKIEEYIGKKYGCLTVTGIDRERRNSVNNRITYVFADCDCGCKNKSYNLSKLKNVQESGISNGKSSVISTGSFLPIFS